MCNKNDNRKKKYMLQISPMEEKIITDPRCHKNDKRIL